MGSGKLITPLNPKKDTHSNVVHVRPVNLAKVSLVKISPDELKAKRVSAYRYLLP